MRNAALVLGIIGGLLAMVVGFFGYGYTSFVVWFGEVPDLIEQVENVALIRAASFLAPLFAIAGGAMAHSRPVAGGVLMWLSGGAIYLAFGFGVFTMFPIAFCLLGGLLALAARAPDAA